MATKLPPPCTPGCRVAVVFPAGRAADATIGLSLLEEWGLQPVIHDPFSPRLADEQEGGEAAGTEEGRVLARCFNTCLPDEERARALEAAFLDESCAAVVCGRGGYGTMRLLELLDWGKLTPAVLGSKRFVGFSDITALHLAFAGQCDGLVTLHGPMPASCFASIPPDDATRLRAALFGGAPELLPPLPGTPLHAAPAQRRVVGRLLGGNLALLSAMVGSRWCPAALAARSGLPIVLALEDIGEPPYRLDRMWQQLRLAGILQHTAAIILGNFVPRTKGSDSEFADFAGNPQGAEPEAFFWREVAGLPSGIPVLWDMRFGHGGANATLPLGAVVAVDAGSGRLELPTAEEAAELESKL